MSANHNHSEGRSSPARLVGALAITAGILVVELVGGLLTNSLALLSDAGHMFADVLALGLALLAFRLAVRPPTARRTFGFYRMEILAALINGILLGLIAIGIVREAIHRFGHVEAVKAGPMLAVAVVGLIANAASALLLARGGRSNLNLRGALLHVLGDAFSSVAVIIGGLVMLLRGWYLIDPIISCLVAVVVLYGAARLVLEAGDILLQAVPRGIDWHEVVAAMKGIPGVADIHDVHIWSLTSGMHSFSAHVHLCEKPAAKADVVLPQIEEMLAHRFGIRHTTIQFESTSCPEDNVLHHR